MKKMNINSKDRRRYHRINIDEEVNLELSGVTYNRCRIKNISIGGMFIDGCFPPKNMENCEIKISYKQQSKEPSFQASVVVAWKNEEGVGFKFTAMNSDSHMFLRRKLINNTELLDTILYDLTRNCPFEIANA